MSVKEMRDELLLLGGSTEGCHERADVQVRLLQARAQRLAMQTREEQRGETETGEVVERGGKLLKRVQLAGVIPEMRRTLLLLDDLSRELSDERSARMECVAALKKHEAVAKMVREGGGEELEEGGSELTSRACRAEGWLCDETQRVGSCGQRVGAVIADKSCLLERGFCDRTRVYVIGRSGPKT